jgi:large subunit ribosomal protein L15
MQKLPKLVTKRKKRLGQGYGSGKGGHTSSRGQKGQKSRGSVGILFEGVKVKKSLIRRLPLQRGKAKFKAGVKPVVVPTDALNIFGDGSEININSLLEKKLVSSTEAVKGVKILSSGKLLKKLTVTVPTSKAAARQIEAAGGKII